MVDNEIISIEDAVRILGRTPRRLRQLVNGGVLVSGRFRGSLTAKSVEAFRLRLESGEVRRGPRSGRQVGAREPFVLPVALEGKTRREQAAALGITRQRVDQLLNPVKQDARSQVHQAVKSGRLVKPTRCSRCGVENLRLHGHHEDYSKPLVVVWLCATCHGRAHTKPQIVKTVPEGMISKRDAAQLLERGVDRVRQLINDGQLVADDRKRWVTLASVKEYQSGINQGRIKRGPKPQKEKTNGSQKRRKR